MTSSIGFINKSRLFFFTNIHCYNKSILPRSRRKYWPLCSFTVSYSSRVTIPQCSVNYENLEGETSLMVKLRELKQRMELIGINCVDGSYTPGHYYHLLCPQCKGGQLMERSLSFHIIQNGDFAMWRCFRGDCGWSGQAFADSYKMSKEESSGSFTVETLGLQPLGDDLIAYFGERMISEETLQRNLVLQKAGDQQAIAFTFRKNGTIVGCKYRTLEKKYWQEKGTKMWLYGLDDIQNADEIIIVEGEIDKLSLAEAGVHNCVSVPCGAPQKVSKVLPPKEKDTACPYIWNCIPYLDKVSRIILATDADGPGEALAEELARRLGKERCWRVRWPTSGEGVHLKDANEVLKFLGREALKEVVEKAELYSSDFPDLVVNPM